MHPMIHSDVFEITPHVGVECPGERNLPSVPLCNAPQKKPLVSNMIKFTAANWPWRWHLRVLYVPWGWEGALFMFKCLLCACLTSSPVSKKGNSVVLPLHVGGHLCSSLWVGGILALCCSCPLSYERPDESFWHLQPLLEVTRPRYPSSYSYVQWTCSS